MYGSKSSRGIDIINERADSALVAVNLFNNIIGVSLVGESNGKSRVEERLLAQSALKHLKFIGRGLLKYFGVRLETDKCARFVSVTDFLKLGNNLASFKALLVNMAVLADLNLKPLRKSINNGLTDAVKTARNLVARAA